MLTTQSFYDKYTETAEAVDQAGKGRTIDSNTSPSVIVGASSVGITPTYNLRTAISNIRQDETLFAAVTTLVDATVSNGWYLRGKNKQLLRKAESRFEERMFTNTVLVPLATKLYPFGNAFVEIVSVDEDGKPWCYVTETTQIEIVDPEGRGEPSMYMQRAGTEPAVTWTAEEIVHFKLGGLDTGLWAEIPIRSLDKYVAIKKVVKDHLYRLFDKNAFRSVIDFPANTIEEDVNRSLAEYALAAKDKNRPFVWFGGVSQTVLQDFADGPRFIELINLCDHAILVQMQVPPIMAGVPDASGRASGEQQTYKAFNTRIKSVQRIIEEYMTNQVLPRMGFGGVSFHFNEVDNKSEKDVLEMAVQLKALGAKPDKLSSWLVKQGIEVDDDFFNPDFYEAPSKADKDALTNKTASSRQGANGERKSIGTGSESSTRSNQLVTQSIDDEIEEAMKKFRIDNIVGEE